MKTRDGKNRMNRRKAVKRGLKYWVLAVGTTATLIAYSVGNSHAIALARVRGTAPSQQTQGQSEARRFDIPPGSMEAVIDAFQKLTGWTVIMPNEAMRGIPSTGLSGVYTPEQALKQLLTGTGVGYQSYGGEDGDA